MKNFLRRWQLFLSIVWRIDPSGCRMSWGKAKEVSRIIWP